MRFVHESVIAAPVARVFAFHERPDALQRLVPPWERVQVLEPPRSLSVGTRVLLRVRLGPFWRLWEARHTRYEKDVLFEDEQVRGPFARWKHTHRFLPAPGGTLLRDEVELDLPGGALVTRVAWPLVRRKLAAMFAFRHAVTAREA